MNVLEIYFLIQVLIIALFFVCSLLAISNF